jgi:plastocyanin
MTHSSDHSAEKPDESTHRPNWRRRSILKATGVGAGFSVFGGMANARRDSTRAEGEQDETDNARPPIIHSQFGYSGTSDDEIPDRLEPDETVELHVDEQKIDDSKLPAITVAFGAFHFAPVGLQVEAGTIVEFDFQTPEHTVTAYHPGQERQQRVPDNVPPFSSTVNADQGFWLYRFEEEGVYDLFCSPHEWAGMGMRIVVGDDPGDVVRSPGRPPLPLTAAVLGTGKDGDIGHPALDPENIIQNGPIPGHDLSIDLEVTLTGPSPT